MTKSPIKIGAVLAAILTLAACGGGGGSSVTSSSSSTPTPSTPTPSTPTPAPRPTPAPTPTPAPSPAPAPSAQSQYQGVRLTAASGQEHTARAQAYTSNTLNEIQVGSRTVTVKYPLIGSGTLNNLGSAHNSRIIVSDRALSYSRFGAYVGPDKTDAEIANGITPTKTINVFSMGQVTADMPTTGTAVYNGFSVGSVKGGYYGGGSSRFNVDFGAKTISGVVSNTAYMDDLRGTISGASFSGAHNGIIMNGHFYGPNAAELGGVYSGTSNGLPVAGSFGAKR